MPERALAPAVSRSSPAEAAGPPRALVVIGDAVAQPRVELLPE